MKNTQQDFLELSICLYAFLSQFWFWFGFRSITGTTQKSCWQWWPAVSVGKRRKPVKMPSRYSFWRFNRLIKSCRITAQCVMRNHTGPVLCFSFVFFLAVKPRQILRSAGACTRTGRLLREGGFLNESTPKWTVVFLGMVQCGSICIFCLYLIERWMNRNLRPCICYYTGFAII